jgi:hypothetical protein
MASASDKPRNAAARLAVMVEYAADSTPAAVTRHWQLKDLGMSLKPQCIAQSRLRHCTRHLGTQLVDTK